jgi:hypothetical protein
VCPVTLLDTFINHLTEDNWIGPDARSYVVTDLHRRLLAQQSSVAVYGFDEPVLDATPANDNIFIAANMPDVSLLQPDQRAVCDCVEAHLLQAMPQTAMHVHVEGEPGGGKSFLLRTLLLRARAMGCSCLPLAFPVKHPAAKGCTDDDTLAIVPIYIPILD